MTKIKEKTNQDDMQMHIQKAFEIIDAHLPDNYVSDVMKKVSDDSKITSGIIRNIRNRTSGKAPGRINVLNALVEVALENKAVKEKLIQNLK